MRRLYGTLAAALMTATVAHGGVIFVNDDASPGGNGDTWATAYKYLQDALAEADTTGDDVWVAAGAYRPDEDENNPCGKRGHSTFLTVGGCGKGKKGHSGLSKK